MGAGELCPSASGFGVAVIEVQREDLPPKVGENTDTLTVALDVRRDCQRQPSDLGAMEMGA